mgnify:CR=1 FL=1|tara:strand:- start:1353 stop:1544 length:192 start_codon:yes stop_codon:yes gene_type:complete
MTTTTSLWYVCLVDALCRAQSAESGSDEERFAVLQAEDYSVTLTELEVARAKKEAAGVKGRGK